MDTKENFYNKLQQLREGTEQIEEDYEKDAAEMSHIYKRASKENRNLARNLATSNQKMSKVMSKVRKNDLLDASRVYKKRGNKYAKKAVTGMDESEQIDEISSKLASNYLKGNHKSVTDKKGIKIWKAFKRADGRELAVDKLSGSAKVPTKD